MTGSGSASFSYKNLTDGDAGYTNVAGLQNISLGINNSVATWDTANLRLFRPSSISTLQVDNLRVAAVPEPATGAVLLIGTGLMAIRRRRAGEGVSLIARQVIS